MSHFIFGYHNFAFDVQICSVFSCVRSGCRYRKLPLCCPCSLAESTPQHARKTVLCKHHEVCAVHRFGVLLKTAHHPTRWRPVPVPWPHCLVPRRSQSIGGTGWVAWAEWWKRFLPFPSATEAKYHSRYQSPYARDRRALCACFKNQRALWATHS